MSRLLTICTLLTACAVSADSETSAAPAAIVRAEAARDGTLADAWRFLGEVRALDRAELAAGASGPVKSVQVREGDRVSRGMPLLQVDAGPASARWQSADAAAGEAALELEQARRDLARVDQVTSGVLAPAEIERARTRVATLEARHKSLGAAASQALAELRRHRVDAPFAGVVSGRHVDPGDWVAPGQPVLDLVSVEAVDIRVDASPELAAKTAVGDAVVVRGDSDVPARVVGVVASLDPVSRTSLVRVVPDEVPAWLVPGRSVEVVFQVEQAGGGVLVPRDALVLSPVDTRVIRIVEGAAAPVSVTVLAATESEALVLGDGLSAGDLVVTRGNERLRPGQPVRMAE